MKLIHTALLALLIASMSACQGDVDRSGDDDDVEEDDPLLGAGGLLITSHWPDIDVPYSQNTKMLSFDQLRNEVLRATDKSWVVDGEDQWEAHRSVLGGADFIDSWVIDRTPNQQKLVTIRKMALRVCQQVVNDEDSPVFAGFDPSAAIAAGDAAVRTQVRSMWERFFLTPPTETEIDESVAALNDLQSISSAAQAWRGLCGAYLSSMRFLSY